MRFTFDVIHRDSFPRQILIRVANSNDDEGAIFETLESCRKAVNGSLRMDVFISTEILANLF